MIVSVTRVESLVYNEWLPAGTIATNINRQLEKIGYKNLGVNARPNLVVLRRTDMPAVLVEVGFINNDQDNALFDSKFDAISSAQRACAGMQACWHSPISNAYTSVYWPLRRIWSSRS